MGKKQAVIFDLNGIFIQSPLLSDRVQQDFGIPTGIFLPMLSEVMEKVRKPNAPSLFSLCKPYLEKARIELDEKEFLHYWFNAEKENKDMTKFARQLKDKGWKLFILSNNFKERTEYYQKTFGFLDDVFDEVFYSWQTGSVKPDAACFLQILKKYRLKAADCFYFDDSEKNVAAAAKLGMKTHVFQGLAATRRVLKR